MTIVYCFDEEFYIYRDLILTSAMLPAVATYCGKEIGSEVYGDDTVPSVCMLEGNHYTIIVEAVHIRLYAKSVAFLVLVKWDTHDDRRCT